MCGSDKEQRPIDSDPFGLYKASCVGTSGIIEPKPPVFTPAVVNAEDDIWRDDDYRPVQENTGEVFRIDNP